MKGNNGHIKAKCLICRLNVTRTIPNSHAYKTSAYENKKELLYIHIHSILDSHE